MPDDEQGVAIIARNAQGRLEAKKESGLQRQISQFGAIIQIDLLEEIADSLQYLRKIEDDQRCLGEERGFVVSVTAEVQEVALRDPVTKLPIKAHTASIYCDGDNDVYICVNYPHQIGQIRLKDGDTQQIDYGKAAKKIERLYVWCAQGETSSLRIHVKY